MRKGYIPIPRRIMNRPGIKRQSRGDKPCSAR
nr:MAG TPA: hypothetical protein [Caudoviricetes sp.]